MAGCQAFSQAVNISSSQDAAKFKTEEVMIVWHYLSIYIVMKIRRVHAHGWP